MTADIYSQALAPMGWGRSLLYFGVPALLMILGLYVVTPALEKTGMSLYMAYSIGMGIPLLILLIASLVGYHLEGNSWTWEAFLNRFNYQAMSLKDWGITALVFAVEMALFVFISDITKNLVTAGHIPLPENIPAFIDPRSIFTTESLDAAIGGLKGNWFIFFFSIGLLLINVLGEEFWWRGLIYPRQEIVFGQWVWLVHGVLWCLFHCYKYWDLPALLPMSIGLVLAVYLTKNNSPGLVIHFITNGSGLISILLGVLR